mgnify:CR=1 FL=1
MRTQLSNLASFTFRSSSASPTYFGWNCFEVVRGREAAHAAIREPLLGKASEGVEPASTSGSR